MNVPKSHSLLRTLCFAALFSAPVACTSVIGPNQSTETADAAPDTTPTVDAGDQSNAMGTDPAIVDDGSSFSLLHMNLSKEEFLTDNWAELQRIVIRANQTLKGQYENARPFTTADLVLTLYAEMAIRDGKVDISATHSEGERGLVPLPENISYWIGDEAPAWDSLHSLEDNVYAFARYLAQVKNKEVGESAGRTLYSGLFLYPGVDGRFLPEARVVSGVIHGYFFSGAYAQNSTIPFDAILQGLASDSPLPGILQGTGYKNATPDRIYILEGRQLNLDEGTTIWQELRK